MNRNNTVMKHIKNVQKRALRMVFNDYSLSYQELLKRPKNIYTRNKMEEATGNRFTRSPTTLHLDTKQVYSPQIINYDTNSWLSLT